MAGSITKLTEKPTAELKNGAYLVVTQQESVDGVVKEAVRRVPADNIQNMTDKDNANTKYSTAWSVKSGHPVLTLTERT